jgi:hypothetical protein
LKDKRKIKGDEIKKKNYNLANHLKESFQILKDGVEGIYLKN